jgi:hypothetical protein
MIGITALLLFTSAAFGAYLEQDYETQQGDREIGTRHRILPPRSRNEVTDLIDRVTIGRPHTERNMTVFPLYVSREEDSRRYLALDDALDHGYLKIYERGSARVSEIEVENRSGRHIFMMAGEILGGGKQNRVISKDALLGPHGGIVAVPVYCVEQRRWASKGSMRFSSERSLAPNSIRALTQSDTGQDSVWREVDRLSKANRVGSSTGNFQAVYEDKQVRSRIAEYDSLKRMPPRAVGAVVAVNGRIVGAEIFCNEDLFDDLWPKVLRSYSLDAISPVPVRLSRFRYSHPLPTRENVRRYLDRVYSAQCTEERGIDAGYLLNISRSISGKALICRRAVIHLNLAGTDHMIFEG